MVYRLAADVVLVVHLVFVVFVVGGGLLVFRWPRMAWLHLPAAGWGASVELGGLICPLTALESSLRIAAGDAGYQGGFVERYLLPVLYPPGLTQETQLLLGGLVVAVNGVVYGLVWLSLRCRCRQAADGG